MRRHPGPTGFLIDYSYLNPSHAALRSDKLGPHEILLPAGRVGEVRCQVR